MYSDTSIVGKGVPLREGFPKVTGGERFVPDRGLNGALWMKILRSPHPHARIKSIDTLAAEALPGVRATLTYKDAPKKEIKCTIFNWRGPVLPDRVRFVGDEVAAVAAESEELAEKALDLIAVEYEKLPAVFDIEEALKPGAPDVIGSGTNKVVTPPEPGTFNSSQGWGDVDKGFKEADVSVEYEVTTHSIYGSIFPPACIAEWNADKLTLVVSHQCPFEIRVGIADTLEIPENRVRVVAPLLAGAFGMLNSAQRFYFLASLLSKKAGKPVIYRMTLEEYGVYKRRESDILHVKMAGKKDGTITALDYEQVHDNGAYGWKSTTYGTLHDMFPRANVKHTAYGISTNKFTSGCIRGVGDVPQAIALNQAVDMLAEKLGLDPITVWKKNHTRTGDPRRCHRVPTTLSSEAYDELIDKGALAIGWEKKWRRWGEPYEVSGAKKRAVGMAVGLHVSGTAKTASASVMINHDGTAQVSIGFMEIGTGCKTTFAQIGAEALGFKFDDVYVIKDVDTETVPFAPLTGASSSLHIGGSSVKVAALDAKRQLLELAFTGKLSPDIFKQGINGPQDLDIKDSFIYVKADPSRRAPIKQIVAPPLVPIIIGSARRQDIQYPGPTAYAIQVGFADVEVDTETGKVNVLKYIACQDSGRIINPEICENQMFSGALMSFGYGLTEEIAFDPATGKALNPALSDYWMWTSMDAPPMEVIFSENIDPVGPFGAKAIGESPAICPHAAIASAIYNATGVRVNKLPITPDKLLKALASLK